MDNYNSLKMSADECVKNNNFDEAVKKYSFLLNMDIETKNLILLNRCFAYLQLEKYDEALEDAKESLILNSNYAKAWSRLGSCLLAKNNIEDAKIAFSKALELNPTNEEYKKIVDKYVWHNELNEEIEDETDEEIENIIKKFKNENSLNVLNQENELKMNIPTEGVMANIFNKMLNNQNLLDLMENEQFQNKLTSYYRNPMEAMQDSQFLGIVKDIIKDLE